MARILVVEDESDLQEVLEYNLRHAGHDVTLTASGREAIRMAQERSPDVVLLDVMLPDISGTEVCRTIRREKWGRDIRVIMLTAKGEEMDRVVGFEIGADDYVTKPFSVRELLLRVQAVARRSQNVEVEPDIKFGELCLNRAAHRVWVAGQEVELTPLEFKLLVTLYDRKNRVQTRDALLADVWGIYADVTTRTVDTHVKRLREKIGLAGDYIQTVRGVGYRFAESPEDAVRPAR